MNFDHDKLILWFPCIVNNGLLDPNCRDKVSLIPGLFVHAAKKFRFMYAGMHYSKTARVRNLKLETIQR